MPTNINLTQWWDNKNRPYKDFLSHLLHNAISPMLKMLMCPKCTPHRSSWSLMLYKGVPYSAMELSQLYKVSNESSFTHRSQPSMEVWTTTMTIKLIKKSCKWTTMLTWSKNHMWPLKYSTTRSLYKDPSTLVMKERQARVRTHSYDLDSLTIIC